MWMSIAKGARYACCDNVTFRAMVMQGIIPRYPSLNPNSSREVVRSEDIASGHSRRRRGARPERDVLLAPIYLDSCIAIGAAARGREPPYGKKKAAHLGDHPVHHLLQRVLRHRLRYSPSHERMMAIRPWP